MATPFRVVTVGWGATLVEGMLDRIEARSDVEFTHVLLVGTDRATFRPRPAGHPLLSVRENPREPLPPPDRELLASLEVSGGATVHNMILADRAVRLLSEEEALGYATHLARRLTDLFRQVRPDVVIGGFDGVHSGMGLAVARSLGIPWYAMYFTTLPQGLCGFCSGLMPDTIVQLDDQDPSMLRALAEQTLDEFRARNLVVLAYQSADSVAAVLRRIPVHARALVRSLRRLATGKYDRITEYSTLRLSREYMRKRKNLMTLPRAWFRAEPPATPYLFFGLQMDPESSLDTWAPFFTNQVNLIELVARAMPPSHRLLVKLHKSDADNYSPAQLAWIRRIPGVDLVDSAALSRTFVEHAALVIAIQGTMAIEAVLLGRPVLMFGESPVAHLPGVTRVGALTSLPEHVRSALDATLPDREDLVRGYMHYLGLYGPGCYYDWERPLPDDEIQNLVGRFEALRAHLAARSATSTLQ